MNTVFPAGAQRGTSIEVTLGGTNLETVHNLHCSLPGCRCERLDSTRFRVTIPIDAQLGLHDLWAVGDNGISAPRTFAVGRMAERVAVESKESTSDAQPIPLETVVNGAIDKAGDVDKFKFEARKGQRVLLECWSERIDSRLRAILELYDSKGRRLAVNRGFFATDPLIDFRVPEDGTYCVKLQDLIASGSVEHYYRLEIHTGPRAAFTIPTVIEKNKASRVTVYGWNLSQKESPADATRNEGSDFEHVEVEIPASEATAAWPLPVPLSPSQVVLAGSAFPYYFPGSHVPLIIGVADVSTVTKTFSDLNLISAPCDISGQLADGEQCDWFAIAAKRGESFVIESFGQRIFSPVDLQISIHDRRMEQPKLLAQFGDEVANLGNAFSTNHLDPLGRWICSSDRGFMIAVKNLSGGLHRDPRRVYRLSVRREEPEFQVVALGQLSGPSGINLQRGGNTAIELLAVRRRSWHGPIRVSAKGLPDGIECPDVWFGPNTDRATMIISAGQSVDSTLGELHLEASAEFSDRTHTNKVHGGAVVRSGRPTGWGRVVSKIPFAVSGKAPLRITANGHESIQHQLYGNLQVRHSPGGIVDVAVHVLPADASNQATVTSPIKLIGTGLSDFITNQTAVIPVGQTKGYLSFQLPTTLPVGNYSLAIRAEATVTMPNAKPESILAYSNPVTIEVQPAAFVVQPDPFAVKQARRGETIQIAYSSRRLNGFIGKMHTELAAPGCITNVDGLRGRGETFVGQSETGSLQIIVNEDAPLGPQRFLRLFTVGVVEDEPIYQGSSFLTLEIVK